MGMASLLRERNRADANQQQKMTTTKNGGDNENARRQISSQPWAEKAAIRQIAGSASDA
jgi:hypothetical protein